MGPANVGRWLMRAAGDGIKRLSLGPGGNARSSSSTTRIPLDSGMVGVKTGLIVDEMAPFRGIMQSGLSSPRLTTLYGESVSAIGW